MCWVEKFRVEEMKNRQNQPDSLQRDETYANMKRKASDQIMWRSWTP